MHRNAAFRVMAVLALVIAALPFMAAVSQPVQAQDDEIIVGLITKTESNPFFVKMKEGAQAAADEAGVQLLTAAGQFDADNASQVTAIENMVTAGAKGILITPGDTKAIVPAIEKAREAGVLVIALDTPTEPMDATDALFATDNFKAGVLIGEYAKSVMGDTAPVIATIDGSTGVSVSVLRHNGFLSGYATDDAAATPTADMTVFADDSRVVCSQDAEGDQAKSQTAMENCLQANGDINVVYTINEPAARGAFTALKAAGREKDVLIVSVDGGCTGIEALVAGEIAATSQQYPLKMAQMGVEAVVNYAKTGEKPTGYTDTGVTLITDNPQEGIPSEDSAFGTENCWG
jgi:fructose transport system substrate-binding protein